MKQLLFTLFCLFAYSSLQAQAVPTDELYGVGIWNADSLGNHRVIVSVDKPADAVEHQVAPGHDGPQAALGAEVLLGLLPGVA